MDKVLIELAKAIQSLKIVLAGLFPRPNHTEPISENPMNVEPPVVPPPPFSGYLWDNGVNVRHSIRMIGDKFGFSPHMKDLLCDIARCESGFNPNAKLVNSPTSIDRGLYQWNNKYHPEITDAIAYNPEQNTILACKALRAGKATLYWSASKPCWNKGGKYDDLM